MSFLILIPIGMHVLLLHVKISLLGDELAISFEEMILRR